MTGILLQYCVSTGSMIKKPLVSLVVAAAIACTPAFAADRDEATVVARDGMVTASSGGSFAEVAKGQALGEGDRLMLVDGASATLRFDNGCRVHYDTPGVFVVPDRDGCAALLAQGGVDWAGAAKITAGVVVAAALLDSMDKVPPPPVSR